MTSRLLYTTIAILIIANVIYRIWPQIKRPHTLRKKLGGKPHDEVWVEAVGEKWSGNIKFLYGIGVLVLLAIMGDILFINALSLRGHKLTKVLEAGSAPVLTSFLIFLAVFVHILISDISTTEYPNLKYAFRVWFTTVMVSPITSVMLLNFAGINYFNSEDRVSLYFYMVIYVHSLGIWVFGILLWMAGYLNKKPYSVDEKKRTMLLLTESLLVIVMLIYAAIININFHIKWWQPLIPEVMILGISIMYYEFEQPLVIGIVE